jgi:hypothetical protein
MRRVLALLFLVLMLAPSPASAADGDRIETGKVGTDNVFAAWTMVDNKATTTTGHWIDWRGYAQGTLHVTGITTATLQVYVSNAATVPADGTDAIQLGSNITANGVSTIVGPYRWVKVKVSSWTSGTIVAILQAVAAAGGSPPPTLTASDTVGNTTTFNVSGATSTVALAGQGSAIFSLGAGTLAATLLPECSTNGGASFVAGTFQDAQSATITLSSVLTNPNSALNVSVVCSTGATHAQVRAFPYTSGSAVGTIRAVASRTPVMMGTDGSNPRVPQVSNTTPVGNEWGWLVRIIGAGAAGVSITDNGPFTVGTTAVNQIGACRQDTPGTTADQRAACLRMNSLRILYVQPTDSGGGDMTDTTNHAVRASLVTIPTIGGQSGLSAVAPFTNCDKNALLNMSTATTTRITTTTGGAIATPVGQRLFVCWAKVIASGTTNVKFVAGTGTAAGGAANCATAQVDITSNDPLTATSGFVGGGGVGAIFDSGGDGSTTGRDLCVTSSQAVTVAVALRYTTY